MRSYPTLGRWLAATVTAAVFAGILIVGGSRGTDQAKDGGGEVKSTADAWVMYGGTIVVGGKVIIGTNNQKPRQKAIMVNGKQVPLVDDKGKPIDLGVLMCFDEEKGKFLWQQVFFKL